MDQEAQRWLAVAAGAPSLLVVSLYAAWEAHVDDLADVREVHTHAECARGDHDPQAFRSKRILDSAAARIRQAAVIWSGGKAPAGDRGGRALGSLDRPRIDKRTPIARIETPAQLLQSIACASRRDSLESQVRPVETGDHHQRIAQPEVGRDVLDRKSVV